MNPYRFSGDRESIQRYQQKYVNLFQEGERVLDLGCGEGFFLELLRGRGVAGVGVDIYADAIEQAKRKGLDVRQADAVTFVTETAEQYDGVFMAHLIEHLSLENVEPFLRQCHKILRPNGRLIVITPNTFDLDVLTERFWSDMTHKWPYPPRLLEALITDAGFGIVSAGDDPDTRPDPRGLGVRGKVRFWLHKIRFGEYFGRGDTVVVARKSMRS